MKDPRGKEAFMKLAAKADIITENFRPGVTKKLGVDYDTISQAQPRRDLRFDVRIRPDRPVRQERRLRHRRARHVGHHDDDRLSRRPPRESRHRDERHRERRHRALQHPRRVHREAAQRQRASTSRLRCSKPVSRGRTGNRARTSARASCPKRPARAIAARRRIRPTRRRTATSRSAATTPSCGRLSARRSAASPNGSPIRASTRYQNA